MTCKLKTVPHYGQFFFYVLYEPRAFKLSFVFANYVKTFLEAHGDYEITWQYHHWMEVLYSKSLTGC